MNRRTLALTILVCVLPACAGAPARHDAARNRKTAGTIAIPERAGAFARALRARLSARGWSLLAYDADRLAERGDYTLLARRARYRLTFAGQRIGDCPAGGPSYRYRVALIANRSGRLAVALTGAQCLSNIAAAFAAELDRKQLVAPGASGAGGG